MKTTKTTTNTYEGQGIQRLSDFEDMLDLVARTLFWIRSYEKASIAGETREIARCESRIEEWRSRILRTPEIFDLMFPPGSAVRMEIGF